MGLLGSRQRRKLLFRFDPILEWTSGLSPGVVFPTAAAIEAVTVLHRRDGRWHQAGVTRYRAVGEFAPVLCEQLGLLALLLALLPQDALCAGAKP